MNSLDKCIECLIAEEILLLSRMILGIGAGLGLEHTECIQSVPIPNQLLYLDILPNSFLTVLQHWSLSADAPDHLDCKYRIVARHYRIKASKAIRVPIFQTHNNARKYKYPGIGSPVTYIDEEHPSRKSGFVLLEVWRTMHRRSGRPCPTAIALYRLIAMTHCYPAWHSVGFNMSEREIYIF